MRSPELKPENGAASVQKVSFWVRFNEKRKIWHNRLFFYNEKVDISVNHDGSEMRSIRRKRPIAPIIAFGIILLLLVASCLTLSADNFSISWSGAAEILKELYVLNPNSLRSLGTWDKWWAYMWSTAVPQIWQTTEMCFIATVFGSLFAIPVYYLSARNVARKAYIYQPVRIVNDLIRTLPTMLIAIFAEFFWGPTSVSGIVAMMVFTLGIMYQLMYEYIETLEMQPYEAVSAAGGRTLQNVHLGLHPSIKPMFFANFLYTFEINIRASIILGYVGAGGFGYEISQRIEEEQYDRVGCLLVPLFIVVCALQITTNIVSRKMR